MNYFKQILSCIDSAVLPLIPLRQALLVGLFVRPRIFHGRFAKYSRRTRHLLTFSDQLITEQMLVRTWLFKVVPVLFTMFGF